MTWLEGAHGIGKPWDRRYWNVQSVSLHNSTIKSQVTGIQRMTARGNADTKGLYIGAANPRPHVSVNQPAALSSLYVVTKPLIFRT
jgi:hypothetical protein